MAVENVLHSSTFQALEDLNTHQYQAITLADGKVANTGSEATGISLNKPKSGEHATCGIVGEMKFRAGGAISATKAITVSTSGYFTAAGSGDYLVGTAKATVTSGSIGMGYFDFNQKIYAFSSSFAW
jgi:hypothetical protein